MKQTLILALLFSFISCGSTEPAQDATTKTEVATTQQIAPATAADTTKTDAVSGATNVAVGLMLNGTMTIPPQSNVTITLPISGIISSFNLLPGTFVQKGSTVAVLENTDFIDMQQSYLDASAQTEYLQAEYNRQSTLAKNDVTSQKRFQQSKAEFLSVKSRKEAMAAKLSMLGIDPTSLEKSGITEKLVVKAPQSGYISEVMVNQGKFISAGEPICQLINKNQILLNLIAYEKDLDKMKIGQQIQFQANGLGNQRLTATITAIDQQVDPINRSVKIYAKANTTNPAFRPGMYVIAMIK